MAAPAPPTDDPARDAAARPIPPQEEEWRGERPWPAFAVSRRHLGHEKRDFSLPIVRHEAFLLLAGLGVLVLIALVVALFVSGGFGLAAVLLTAFLVTVCLALATMPLWAAAILDDVEDHGPEIEERADS